MEKRYKKTDSEFEFYNDNFIQYKIDNVILNPASNSIADAHTFFRDKENLKARLYQLAGDENGSYVDNWKTTLMAFLPSAEKELQDIELEFKDYCDSEVNMGKARPDIWPKKLLQKRLKTEAKFDVLILERQKIESELQKYENIKIERDDSMLLKNGPIGS